MEEWLGVVTGLTSLEIPPVVLGVCYSTRENPNWSTVKGLQWKLYVGCPLTPSVTESASVPRLCPSAGLEITEKEYKEQASRMDKTTIHQKKKVHSSYTCYSSQQISVLAAGRLHCRLSRVKKHFKISFYWIILFGQCLTWVVLSTFCHLANFFSCQAIHSGLWCEK